MTPAELQAWCDERNAGELRRMKEIAANLRAKLAAHLGPKASHYRTRHITAEQVRQAVDDCYGDKQAAANLLGIPLPAVYRRLHTANALQRAMGQ